MLLSEIRDQFPVSRHYAYFNHAAIAPVATSTRQAMEAHLADQAEFGALHFMQWLETQEGVRATLGGLIGATAADIALTKNTTEGLLTIANGLAWRPGERVVTFECEFPANLYPWLALRGRGVNVELLPTAALTDLNQVRAACRGAKVLAISFVQYLSGFRAPLEAIGAICRETGTWLVVDGIQGLGAFPLDVTRCGIHALACGSHKWLTCPEGAGFLYVHPALLEQLTPPEPGWLSVDNYLDFDAAQRAAQTGIMHWRAGAARFECGAVNRTVLLGMGAAIKLLLSAGADTAANHILDLGQRLADGLDQRGCTLALLSDDRSVRSGITSFQHPREEAASLVPRLEAAGILCSQRGPWVRVAPHLYNTPDEIDRLLAELPA
ncbi:MAG: aminotransferase class V-fold PLP-dependent enzyme [Acidobacteria bacterium]|nr:MAG: aminotransferase class V-fold PLP-dependent enzyme [Acidobacteriota bacterium]